MSILAVVGWRLLRVMVATQTVSAGAAALDQPCPSGSTPMPRWHWRGTEVACQTAAGRRHGPFVIVNRAGSTVERGQYRDEAVAGPWQSWYDSGGPLETGEFEAGQRIGRWTRWHENGRKQEEGDYDRGEEVGIWRTWDPQGRLLTMVPRGLECPPPLRPGEWKWGAGVQLHPESGAAEARVCRRSDGIWQGSGAAWWDPRRLAQVGSFCDGETVGRWSFFWRNGVLAREGRLAGQGRMDGVWTDWDRDGRPLLEVTYADGREVSRRALTGAPGSPRVADPAEIDAVALERYRDALRQPCTATAVPPRPYEGLRAELRSAEGVIRVRVTGIQIVDPSPWVPADVPPARQHVHAVVQKVLSGSIGRPGEELELLFSREHAVRFALMPQYASTFSNGPRAGFDQTAFVRQEGDRLVLLNLLAADDSVRTDDLLTLYHALARSDERTFAIGLARLVSSVVRSDPDRLVWMGWTPIVFDDWNRLQSPPTTDDPVFKVMVADAHRAVVAQVHRVAEGHVEWLDIHNLPWLIRFLSEAQRRELTGALLRLHVFAQRELEEAGKAVPEPAPEPVSPLRELSMEQVRALSAYMGVDAVLRCLALAVDPRADGSPPPDTLDRARAFVSRGGR